MTRGYAFAHPSGLETTDSWATPQTLVDELAAEFGPFTLDPAADELNHKAPAYYTKAQNGLLKPWRGRVWLNPPYGKDIGLWLAKARTEVAVGRAEVVVALVPVRTGSKWWHAHTGSAEVRFLKGRVKFIRGGSGSEAVPEAPPFDSAVLIYGKGKPGAVVRVPRVKPPKEAAKYKIHKERYEKWASDPHNRFVAVQGWTEVMSNAVDSMDAEDFSGFSEVDRTRFLSEIADIQTRLTEQAERVNDAEAS